jgi:hypothetical protein
MDSLVKTGARIAALRKEMDAIHFANNIYWQRLEGEPTQIARAEYQRRLDRLEEIRGELAKLKASR